MVFLHASLPLGTHAGFHIVTHPERSSAVGRGVAATACLMHDMYKVLEDLSNLELHCSFIHIQAPPPVSCLAADVLVVRIWQAGQQRGIGEGHGQSRRRNQTQWAQRGEQDLSVQAGAAGGVSRREVQPGPPLRQGPVP